MGFATPLRSSTTATLEAPGRKARTTRIGPSTSWTRCIPRTAKGLGCSPWIMCWMSCSEVAAGITIRVLERRCASSFPFEQRVCEGVPRATLLLNLCFYGFQQIPEGQHELFNALGLEAVRDIEEVDAEGV